MRTLPRALVLCCAALAAPVAAQAQAVFYGTGASARADFLAYVGGGATTNTLDGASGSTIGLGALGAATLVTNGGGLFSSRIEGNGGGAATPAYSLTFTSPIAAFGGTFDDVGTCCGELPFPIGTLRVAFFAGASSVGVFSQLFTTTGPAFFGVAGLPQFDRVEVYANAGDIIETLDLAAGPGGAPSSTVPEPGSYALLGSGLLALAGMARMRRRT